MENGVAVPKQSVLACPEKNLRQLLHGVLTQIAPNFHKDVSGFVTSIEAIFGNKSHK